MKLAIIVLILAVIGVCQAAISDEVEARKFAKKVSGDLYNFYDNIAEKAFNADEDDFESLFSSVETIRATSKALVEVVKDSRQFDYNKFKDSDLREVFRTISKSAGLLILEEEYFSTVASTLNSLKELASDKDIEKYKCIDCEYLSYFPDVQKLITQSNDPDELLYYWQNWREKNSQWSAIHFYTLIQSLKTAANLTGVPVLELWSEFYDIEEMENVMLQVRPLYQQLHAFIRNQLYEKYGPLIVKENGPIPDHLFQQVLAQAWTNDSVIDDIYPHKNLPPYDKILSENEFNANMMFGIASDFYKTLGFDPIPKEFWDSRFKLNSNSDTGDCRADIYDLTSNVHMKFCHKVDFRKFLQAHGYMGRIYYALEKKNLPFYYFSSYDLEYPLGEASILSASTPKHLKEIGLVKNFDFSADVQMNRLLRMGIHTMMNLPTFFVHTKVMHDLLADTVDIENLNKHYWKLMDEFAGVEPPTDRPDNFFDFPFKFYIDLDENTQARKFVSEILGYQFYRKLCEISGQYPAAPLNNCDFFGSKAAGDALKKMMKLGSSKPFHEVLGQLLPGDAKLNGEGLLEYYKPIASFLEDKNKESEVKIGWIPSKRKVA
ncbi:angiotensin-converting enzyme-like [Eupeodes corollae]|uniref:angiotensin-converting enzyme-like n=1 Tax=Eupeodes corollae TaxID=290404 RepID=UPI002490685E|nr:angiotensin-converting enzyme-like [Eupeodes corollae]